MNRSGVCLSRAWSAVSLRRARAVGSDERLIHLGLPYVHALRDGHAPDDPRIGPSATFGKDWLPGVYESQLRHLAQKREHDGTPG
jgi:hypothetical protein